MNGRRIFAALGPALVLSACVTTGDTRLKESPSAAGAANVQLGAAYLHVLASVDRPLMEWHRANVATIIERDRNFLEVYTTDGQPYKGRAFLYYCDEGMIWASMFLDLYR